MNVVRSVTVMAENGETDGEVERADTLFFFHCRALARFLALQDQATRLRLIPPSFETNDLSPQSTLFPYHLFRT